MLNHTTESSGAEPPAGFNTSTDVGLWMLVAAMDRAGLTPVSAQNHGRQIVDALNTAFPGLNVWLSPSDAPVWPGFGSIDVTIDSGLGGWSFRPDGWTRYEDAPPGAIAAPPPPPPPAAPPTTTPTTPTAPTPTPTPAPEQPPDAAAFLRDLVVDFERLVTGVEVIADGIVEINRRLDSALLNGLKVRA